MGTVTIQLPPAPAHVRTARLIAAAMARRAGVDEQLMDEIRLAVGEACARAVQVQMLEGVTTPITVELADDDGFTVVIADSAATAAPIASATQPGAADRWPAAEAAPIAGLAILTAVVDDVQVSAGRPRGTRVQVRWPVARG